MSPTQPQEIREELLSLEETIKQLEVVWPGGGSGEEGAKWRSPDSLIKI